MRNAYKLLRDLIPTPPLQVGIVLAVGGGVAIVELPGGGRMTVRGASELGAKVFFRDGVIEGLAPNLPIEIIEV